MNRNSLNLQLDTDQELIAREVPSQRILEVRIRAPKAAEHSERPAVNLALVLDRSGSMSGEKLEFVKQAAVHVLELLQEQDHVALVAYDDEITLLSPSTRGTTANRSELKRQVSRLRPGGMTNLSGGWLAGCHEVAAAAQEGTLNRTLLLTDGLANVGETDLERLAHQARELSKRSVSTSTFGVGDGFNEYLLEAMSNQGGGNFYFIETPSDIPGLFLREFKELAAASIQGVELIIEFPPQIKMQVLGGWVSEFSTGQLRISLGNLFSDQNLDIYIKLSVPPTENIHELGLKARIYGKIGSGELREDQAEVTFEYSDQSIVDAAPRKRDLLERYAPVDMAENTTEALKLERLGKNEMANQLLKQSLRANQPYLDPSVSRDYQRLSERMKDGMLEADRKQTHYNNYSQKRKREQ